MVFVGALSLLICGTLNCQPFNNYNICSEMYKSIGEFWEILRKIHSCFTGVAPLANCNISLEMYKPWDSRTSGDVLKIPWNVQKIF